MILEPEIRESHPNPAEMRFCAECGWHGTFGEMKHALWLDSESNVHAGLRVQAGGDGMKYRCPKCNTCILFVYYPKNKIVHK